MNVDFAASNECIILHLWLAGAAGYSVSRALGLNVSGRQRRQSGLKTGGSWVLV